MGGVLLIMLCGALSCVCFCVFRACKRALRVLLCCVVFELTEGAIKQRRGLPWKRTNYKEKISPCCSPLRCTDSGGEAFVRFCFHDVVASGAGGAGGWMFTRWSVVGMDAVVLCSPRDYRLDSVFLCCLVHR